MRSQEDMVCHQRHHGRQCSSRQRLGQQQMWKTKVIFLSFLVLVVKSSTTDVENCTGSQPPSADDDGRTLFKIGVLYTVKEGQRTRPAYYLGAIPYAIEKINSDLLCNEPFKLGFWAEDTMGDVKRCLRTMTTKRNDTIAFVGPEKQCYVEAYFAAAWNKPLITYNCQDASLSDSSVFTSFARTISSTSKISRYVISLLQHFKWTRFTLIYQDSTKWRGAAETLQKECEQLKLDIMDKMEFAEDYVPDGPVSSGPTMEKILLDTYKRTRVYVFFGDYDALIDFVRKMFLQGFANGEYVVISLKDDSPRSSDQHYEYYAHINDPKSLEWYMVEPLRVLLLLQPVHHGGDAYKRFINISAQYSMRQPFSVPAIPSSTYAVDYTKLATAVYAAYLYDAINLLALAIKDTLAAGGNVYNGTEITMRIRKKPYTSILGDEMLLNEHGETQHVYSVYALKTDKKAPHGKSIQPVGNFSRPTPGRDRYEIPSFFEYPDSPIEWIGDQPPLNEPKCGFDGSKCHWPIAISCVVSASIIIIVFVFGCRHYIYEQKLARLLWKIEYMDLLMAEPEMDPTVPEKLKNKHCGRIGSCTSFAKGSIMNNPAVTAHSSFLTVASYKGSLVVVKGFRKRHIEINRAVKKELYYIKEMSHDNINRFIGACLDQPTVCIVTQYCTRGSLKDILEKDDLPLDDMFTASLIFDLIKGMIYLHDSEVVSHGNLKPSNCLVDSRWVLQIADFGLHFLRSSDIPTKADSSERLLYRAPELLRMRCPPPQGTQKGDVYSFAIILHEIHSRSGPWGNCAASAEEILERVRSVPLSPELTYRPDTSQMTLDECTVRCMMECWEEDPDLRPEFKYIRIRLKPMQRGLRSNIFDNMLAIMEKYANTLEAIVEERTNQLVEEKKKTEALLLRMLPKSVADQLKRGEMVEPEQYECVTIYFSDIVGFTALSAESTPLQVVTLLNDLYTMFDSIIGEYDVYKVETIGDAYMVVSGLPIRNEDNHAGEVASMSLHLLSAIQDFRIRHQPTETLKLRIGIHSGPCVTGVVGMKMPRYCLFGDTVNTASRMETTGVPLKIHCSPQTKAILDKLGGYYLEERGFVLVKGKGEVFTYFLTGEDITHRQRRISLLKKQRQINRQTTNYPNLCDSSKSLFEHENEASFGLRVANGRTLNKSNVKHTLDKSRESMA